MADVRKRGDRALLRYAAQFDGLAGARSAARHAGRDGRGVGGDSIPRCAMLSPRPPSRFAALPSGRCRHRGATSPLAGLTTGQLVRPLGSVGCYVPSGRHPLPSTLLMTAIPAQVAGVERIVVVSPKPAPETLAAAHLLGITEFYRLGGAHAVAALAYGTATICRASTRSSGRAISTSPRPSAWSPLTAPSTCSPARRRSLSPASAATQRDIASDLVAQAEHDPEALAIFVTTREELAQAVIAETKLRSRDNPVAREALERNGLVIRRRLSVEEARAITNRLAPEHLTVDAASDLEWVENAGSVFVGRWSAQPMGDYISGPNHTLPTGGMARVRGGLSVNDFVKLITVQEYTAQGMRALGPKAALLAEAEGLDRPRRSDSHARAAGRGRKRVGEREGTEGRSRA